MATIPAIVITIAAVVIMILSYCTHRKCRQRNYSHQHSTDGKLD